MTDDTESTTVSGSRQIVQRRGLDEVTVVSARDIAVRPHFTPGRALPAQSPPVNDIELLEYRAPEVPAGQVVRYPVRTGIEVVELPDFDAEWKVPQRRHRAEGIEHLLDEQEDGRRRWRRRALGVIALVTVCVIVVAAVGIVLLSQLR